MYNWSVDEQYFQKHDPEGYKIWRLLQLINYGLDGERLRKKQLKKYWFQIKDKILDPPIKEYLQAILWPLFRRYGFG